MTRDRNDPHLTVEWYGYKADIPGSLIAMVIIMAVCALLLWRGLL